MKFNVSAEVSEYIYFHLYPSDVSKIEFDQIQGGENIVSSAKIFMDVIQNKGTEAQQNVVCANAGMAIATALDLEPIDGFLKAKESILSGNAMKSFKTLQKLSSK